MLALEVLEGRFFLTFGQSHASYLPLLSVFMLR